MHGNPVGGTVGAGDIGTIYRNAAKQGYKVTLLSKGEFDRNTANEIKAHEENSREVTMGELHPGAGKSGIPARRLLYRKRR